MLWVAHFERHAFGWHALRGEGSEPRRAWLATNVGVKVGVERAQLKKKAQPIGIGLLAYQPLSCNYPVGHLSMQFSG